MLQRILNGLGAHLVEDGIIGPAVVRALNRFPPKDVYRRYKKARIDYYQKLGKRFPMFLKGWLKRVNSFPDL